MKLKFGIVSFCAILAACSSTPKEDTDNGNTPRDSQTLSSTFKREGIKVEWNCMFGTGFSKTTCVQTSIKYIEATGYAPSFGNSEALRENAFKVANDVAMDKLIRFVKQDINSTRVTTTLAKNIERANDRIKSKIRAGEEVSMNDDDAMKDTNYSVRENTNETVRQITESIRTNANGIIRGARAIDERIVDRQTVAVTVRWEQGLSKSLNSIRKQFGN